MLKKCFFYYFWDSKY